jgi:phage tail-like protein
MAGFSAGVSAGVGIGLSVGIGGGEDAVRPFTGFNFSVELAVPDFLPRVCSAAFSDCDGLEMTMEAKSIREGGNNAQVHRLAGPLAYGTLTLKRGMTATFDLWDWFSHVAEDPTVRADGEVVMYAEDGGAERARFVLTRCLPVKLKAPQLNAKEGAVAIEEFQLAYESLTLKRPDEGGFGA